MRIVVDNTGLVVMWSEGNSPTPPPGGSVVELSAAQAEAFDNRPANGGMHFDGAAFTFLPPSPTGRFADPDRTALIRRRAAALEQGDLADQVAALRLRLQLLEGG